jgi:hypothetical protein
MRLMCASLLIFLKLKGSGRKSLKLIADIQKVKRRLIYTFLKDVKVATSLSGPPATLTSHPSKWFKEH